MYGVSMRTKEHALSLPHSSGVVLCCLHALQCCTQTHCWHGDGIDQQELCKTDIQGCMIAFFWSDVVVTNINPSNVCVVQGVTPAVTPVQLQQLLGATAPIQVRTSGACS